MKHNVMDQVESDSERMRSGVERRQVGGRHYVDHAIQPWDIIDEYGLDYYEGNALKYLLRRKTDRIEDLEKAIHYIEKRISILKDAKYASEAEARGG